MFYLNILNNIALLVTLSVVHNQIVTRLRKEGWTYPVLSGLLFGIVGVVVMMNPVKFMPGVIFDGRSIILCVAGLFGGPITATVGAVMCAVYRIRLGGSGALMGVSVITASALLGVAFHYYRRNHPSAMRPQYLYTFGLAVHLVMLALMGLLPGAAQAEAYRQIAIPVILIYPVATLLVCLLFLDQESRLKAQRELRESEECYRILADFSRDWEYWLRPDKSFRYMSPSCERITGYAASEFMNDPELFLRIVHPDDLAAFLEHMDNYIPDTVDKSEFAFRIRTRNGDLRWINHYCLPVHTTSGAYLGRRACNRDATESRRAEEALRESERLYQSLVENLPQSVFRKDCDGRFTFVNGVFCQTLGKTPGEVLGQDDYSFYPRELADQYRADDASVMESGEAIEKEEEYQPLGGPQTFVHVVKVPLRDAEGTVTGVQGLCWDITERMRLEDQLRQAQKMEAIGQLAGGVAHDFNNLLQVILVNSDFAQGALAPNTEVWEEIDEVRKAAERAADLTRQLLAFSRRQVIRPQNLDMNELVQGMLKMLGRLIGENIEVRFFPAERLDAVRVDKSQIEQILMNLCLNARDSMPQGGKLTLSTEGAVIDGAFAEHNAWAAEGRYVLLSVADSGRGMDAATCARVFEPFFTTKGVGEGTGLGLATVYGIVKQHGGLVHLNSEPDVGTVFKVYLPVAASAAEIPVTVPQPSVEGGAETILVAEDEPMVLELVARTLRSAGYTVLTARDGAEALQVFTRHAAKIDLALLDAMMPGLSGREVMERIHAEDSVIPFLFSSGYSSDAVHANFVAGEDRKSV
ncbi:MAG: PAS domain S-box protein, partial [FCB group bacterium]|nr:PAS domain S-box protein [FCB group bacterium]